jgi:prefoldin subunit 5
MTRQEVIDKAQRFQDQMNEIDQKIGELNAAKLQLLGRVLELNDALSKKNMEDMGWDFS